jgi:hypothetical protein
VPHFRLGDAETEPFAVDAAVSVCQPSFEAGLRLSVGTEVGEREVLAVSGRSTLHWRLLVLLENRADRVRPVEAFLPSTSDFNLFLFLLLLLFNDRHPFVLNVEENPQKHPARFLEVLDTVKLVHILAGSVDPGLAVGSEDGFVSTLVQADTVGEETFVEVDDLGVLGSRLQEKKGQPLSTLVRKYEKKEGEMRRMELGEGTHQTNAVLDATEVAEIAAEQIFGNLDKLGEDLLLAIQRDVTGASVTISMDDAGEVQVEREIFGVSTGSSTKETSSGRKQFQEGRSALADLASFLR